MSAKNRYTEEEKLRERIFRENSKYNPATETQEWKTPHDQIIEKLEYIAGYLEETVLFQKTISEALDAIAKEYSQTYALEQKRLDKEFIRRAQNGGVSI